MTTVICLLAVLVVLVALVLVALNVLLVAELVSAEKSQHSPDKAMETGEDQRKPGSLDEGFENLMQFSVGGRSSRERDE